MARSPLVSKHHGGTSRFFGGMKSICPAGAKAFSRGRKPTDLSACARRKPRSGDGGSVPTATSPLRGSTTMLNDAVPWAFAHG